MQCSDEAHACGYQVRASSRTAEAVARDSTVGMTDAGRTLAA